MRKVAKTVGLLWLMEKYSTQKAAIEYFEHRRWKGNLTCSRCNSKNKITPQKRVGQYWCGYCRKYFTALTGTPLESSHLDLRLWILAGYLLLTSRKGISSLQLSKELDITQKTAWYMLHRLRLM